MTRGEWEPRCHQPSEVLGKDYAKGGDQCNEYPFATTCQGCAESEYYPRAPRNNFSVMPVPKDDNRSAGILLAQFYTKNRRVCVSGIARSSRIHATATGACDCTACRIVRGLLLCFVAESRSTLCTSRVRADCGMRLRRPGGGGTVLVVLGWTGSG
ncbi:NucA/NucB deoxyribonuclease domain-containing protein [Streptomyces sp. NPDC054933]